MQIIDMSQPGLFIVNTTTNAFIVYVATDICQENEELMELCKADIQASEELMARMFQVMLVVGVVHNALQVALVVAHLHFQLVDVFFCHSNND